MSLADCLAAHNLSGHVCKGLQALGKHSICVQQQYGSARASVNLDAALAQKLPRDHRWDYGIEVKSYKNTRLVWIEVHPATSSEVETVCCKLIWLRQFLNQNSVCKSLSHEFFWVSTNAGTHIDQQRQRRLSACGLKKPTRFVVV